MSSPGNAPEQAPRGPLELLRRKPQWRPAVLVFLVIGVLLGAGIAIGGVYWAVPSLWNWGFGGFKLTSVSTYFAALAALVGELFLITILIWAPILPIQFIWKVLSLSLDEKESDFKRTLDSTREAQREVEERLKEIEHGDPTGLIPLVQYSRLQLESYYAIGTRQTQQSFRFSVIAMSIGFVIMMAGVAPHVIPPTWLNVTAPPLEVNILIISGGIVIELISAMFLWIYRNSMAQFTYFYNRQMDTHSVLMCFKIAATMGKDEAPKALDSKALIIQKVLERTWEVQRPEAPSSKSIKDLLSSVKPGNAA